MSKIGNIRVDVVASDAAYYAYAPHDSVTLPMAPDDLQNVINEMTYHGRHDYAIEDIRTSGKFDKLHFAEDEHVDLRALNAMAECVKRNPDLDYDAVRDYCDNFDVPVDPLMVGNVIMQANEMTFFAYTVDVDSEVPLLSDLWRAYGLTLLDQASSVLEACANDNRLSLPRRRLFRISVICSQTCLPRRWVPGWPRAGMCVSGLAAISIATPMRST